MTVSTDAGTGPAPILPALLIGAVALMVLGVQPVLYGAYVHAGLIGEARLGTLAAAEISAIAAGSVAGIALLRNRSARQVGLAGLALLVLGNLLPLAVPLFVDRAVAGFGGGMAVALAAAQIATRRNVNAASGWFLFLQAISQYAILQVLTLLGATGSATTLQLSLAALAVAASPLLLGVPKRLTLHDEDGGARPPTAAGWTALAASGLFVGAAIGVWAYLGIWLEAAGMAEEAVSPRLTATLAGQMAGALFAVALGTHRHSSVQVMVGAGAMILAVALLLARGPEGFAGWTLVIGFGFAWMAGSPALSGLLLEIDPERRALPYGASAQLLGAAVIPTAVGELLAASGLGYVLAASAALAGGSVLAVVAALALRPRG